MSEVTIVLLVLIMAAVVITPMILISWENRSALPRSRSIPEIGQSHGTDLKGTWTFNTTTKTYLVQPHRCHDGACKIRTWHLCVSTDCLKDITLTHEVHTCHDSRCQYNVKHKCHNLDCKERKA